MNLKVSTDLLAGVFFAMLGASSMVISSHYHLGTPARMGPGYFPLMIGIVLVLLGGWLVFLSFFERAEPVGNIGLRQIACILLGIAAFGALIESGLVPATVAAVLISSFARPVESLLEAVLVAAGLALFAALVFVYALGLPMRLFPF